MFTAIKNLVLYRFLGGRVMLALTLLGVVRRLLGRRRRPGGTSAYQPSQGSSQIVQRDPR